MKQERHRKYLIWAVGIFMLLGCDHLLPSIELNTNGGAWSHDNRYIIFAYNAQIDNFTECIYKFDIETGRVQQLTLPPYCSTYYASDSSPAWSPTSPQIIFPVAQAVNNEQTSILYIMNNQGKNINRLPIPNYGRSPSWSMDGEHIAFIHYTNYVWQVAIMDASATNLQPLTAEYPLGSTSNWIPDWSSDEQYIKFETSSTTQIVHVNTGETLCPLDRLGCFYTDSEPVWLYDNTMAYLKETWERTTDATPAYNKRSYFIQRINLEGKELNPITQRGNITAIGASHSGTQLAYFDQASRHLFIYDVFTDQTRQLQWEIPELEWRNPFISWSHDNERLLFGNAGLFVVIDVESGEMITGLATAFSGLSKQDEEKFILLDYKKSADDQYINHAIKNLAKVFLIGIMMALLIAVLFFYIFSKKVKNPTKKEIL